MSRACANTFARASRWLDDLEASVVTAELALRNKGWQELGEALADQRRHTHGLMNALDEEPLLSIAERSQIDERIATILARRATQLQRLESFHAEVGRRLRELSHFKFALREMSTEAVPLALNTRS